MTPIASGAGTLKQSVYATAASETIAAAASAPFVPGATYPPPLGYRVDAAGRCFDMATGRALTTPEVAKRWEDLTDGVLLLPSSPQVNTADLTSWRPSAPRGWEWQGPRPTVAAPAPVGKWIGPTGKVYAARFTDWPWAHADAGKPMQPVRRSSTVPAADPPRPSPVALPPRLPPQVGAVPSPVLLKPGTPPASTVAPGVTLRGDS